MVRLQEMRLSSIRCSGGDEACVRCSSVATRALCCVQCNEMNIGVSAQDVGGVLLLAFLMPKFDSDGKCSYVPFFIYWQCVSDVVPLREHSTQSKYDGANKAHNMRVREYCTRIRMTKTVRVGGMVFFLFQLTRSCRIQNVQLFVIRVLRRVL
jgi:hypothetical protein